MVSGILAVGDKLGLVVYCGISCKLGISGIAAVSKHMVPYAEFWHDKWYTL